MMPKKEPSEKWYYDACTLDDRLNTYAEMINSEHKSYTSHLAIGEACANCLLKAGKTRDYELLNLFIDLLKKLRNLGVLEVVGNDGVEVLLSKIKEILPAFSVTDSIHLATALREQCCIFRTIDNDFIGLSKTISKQLSYESGIANFNISMMSSKNKDELFHIKKSKRRNMK